MESCHDSNNEIWAFAPLLEILTYSILQSFFYFFDDDILKQNS